MEHHKLVLETYSSTDSPPPHFSSSDSETEEEPATPNLSPPPTWRAGMRKRALSKQLSMRETKREVQWEKRRRQMYRRSRSGEMAEEEEEEMKGQEEEEEMKGRARSLTDEDLEELRGSIELGFGFNEENGGEQLCRTLPALNLYFAVKRQISDPKLRQSPSPASTPTGTATSSGSTIYGTPSPRSPDELPPRQESSAGGSDDTWKMFKPGDSPQHVKMRLRHWAQIVACSVRQCC